MKSRLLVIIGILFSSGFVIANVYADCDINRDWSDAPCMDQIINNQFPQYQVDKWSEYYDYKGEQFMESKKTEMNNAIKSNQLMKWMDESIQNENVWQYYYFSEQAPNPYPYLQNVEFESIELVLTKKQLADGQIFCIGGYKQVGSECVPDDGSKIFNYEIFYVVLLIILTVIFLIIIYLWRKRK